MDYSNRPTLHGMLFMIAWAAPIISFFGLCFFYHDWLNYIFHHLRLYIGLITISSIAGYFSKQRLVFYVLILLCGGSLVDVIFL